MAKSRNPRHGSMQFWPRKRAKSEHPRIRSVALLKETSPCFFAGYKAGMTHILFRDERPNSMTKGSSVFMPVTVIECPPLKVAAIRFYKKSGYGINPVGEILAKTNDKNLARKITLPKKEIQGKDISDYDDIRIIAYTQPSLTGIGKKKPEIFEISLGGEKEQKLAYAKEKLGKEITLKDVFKDGQLIDTHAVTKGKGFQGPVKRFGISLKSHKSEKKRRSAGNLGPWQQSAIWRVAQAGQMGYHTRTEYNKEIIMISAKPEDINLKGGFPHYGNVKNDYIIVKGSVQGHQKRLILLNHAVRPDRKQRAEKLSIEHIRK